MNEIPVVRRIGLWMLDDANDSNPYAYISKGPCSGMIIHFSHDPEPEIKFSSLKRFLDALRGAGINGTDIDDIQKERIAVPLDETVRELVIEDTDDATFLLTTYLSIASDLALPTKESLVGHFDFFVREAVAGYFARRSLAEDLAFAEKLASDKHQQVSTVAKKAVAAIRKNLHSR